MFQKFLAILIFALFASACAAQSLPSTDQSQPSSPDSQVPSFELAPTDTPLPTPTQIQLEATVTTQEAPTPTSPAAFNPNDQCQNPFYPVVNGASWEYENSSVGNFSHTITTGQDGAFTILVQTSDTTFTIEGICTQDGIILMNQSSSTTVSDSDGSAQVVSEYQEGITLPNDIQVGDDWSQTMNITAGDFSAAGTDSFIAVGYETVTVPAGTFYALKIEQTSTLEMGGGEMVSRSTLWYAEGVGNVKTLTTVEADKTYESNLLSYNIP
jgi:hypothetical protein